MRIRNLKELVKKTVNSISELQWANVFHDTIQGYEWYNVSSLSLGRWAVGYNYAYAVSRILQEIHPRSILELGLGQSTKIISSYVEYYRGKNPEGMGIYDIVEHNKEWVDFFCKNSCVSDVGTVHIREMIESQREGGGDSICIKILELLCAKKSTTLSRLMVRLEERIFPE